MRGSLYDRLRGSNKASTLTPDMDNAIVGSHITDCYTGISKSGIPVFVAYFFEKRCFWKKHIQAEGERPVLFVMRWEPVFQGERMLLSIDRTKPPGFVDFKKYEKRKNK